MRKSGCIQSFVLIILILWIAIPVSGDVLPPEPAETQGIGISTDLIATGVMSQQAELQWRISSEVLGANLLFRGFPPEPVIEPEPPLNPGGEVQSHVAYLENTRAVSGSIAYRKESSLDTSVQPGTNPNVENVRQITFVAGNAGRLFSTEDISMYNVGNSIRSDGGAICPFLPGIHECIPMFCNRAEAGSLIDMSIVSALTSSGIRNVNPAGDPGYWTPVPVVDGPALSEYRIRVAGPETSPSIGLVSAYSRIEITEGGSQCPGEPIIAQQLRFAEDRTATGDVSLFQYLVSYESGLIR